MIVAHNMLIILLLKSKKLGFKKLAHPKRKEIKMERQHSRAQTEHSSVAVNNRRAVKSRNALSALAIGLVGFSTVLFGVKFPAFNTISHNNTEYFINITSAFLNRSVDRQLRCGSGGKKGEAQHNEAKVALLFI